MELDFSRPDKTTDNAVIEAFNAKLRTECLDNEHSTPLEAFPGIYGREVVLFLGPSHNRSTERWEVMGTWDVQQEEGEVAKVIHPERDLWKRGRTGRLPDLFVHVGDGSAGLYYCRSKRLL